MRVKLCAECRTAEQAWLDRTGPLHHGIQIMQVGTGNHSVPSWTRTYETVRAQVQVIHDICRQHHGANASVVCRTVELTVD